MKDIAPADTKAIEEFCAAVRSLKWMNMPTLNAGELFTRLDIVRMMIKMLPVMGTVSVYSSVTHQQLAENL